MADEGTGQVVEWPSVLYVEWEGRTWTLTMGVMVRHAIIIEERLGGVGMVEFWNGVIAQRASYLQCFAWLLKMQNNEPTNPDTLDFDTFELWQALMDGVEAGIKKVIAEATAEAALDPPDGGHPAATTDAPTPDSPSSETSTSTSSPLGVT